MKKREYTSRLKEFRLGGVVDKTREGWTIPYHDHRFGGDMTVCIIPSYTHRGSRVGWVAFSGPHLRIRALRALIDALPSRKTRQTHPISPSQLFEMLGKLARGELKE